MRIIWKQRMSKHCCLNWSIHKQFYVSGMIHWFRAQFSVSSHWFVYIRLYHGHPEARESMIWQRVLCCFQCVNGKSQGIVMLNASNPQQPKLISHHVWKYIDYNGIYQNVKGNFMFAAKDSDFLFCCNKQFHRMYHYAVIDCSIITVCTTTY